MITMVTMMTTMIMTFAVTVALAAQNVAPGAKAMFYNPGGLATKTPPQLLAIPGRQLRPINFQARAARPRHCGIHYWLETAKGNAVTVTAAKATDDARIAIIWARSQTEVAGGAARARERLIDMPQKMEIATESEESVPGETGTYVVNRQDAGVAAEIVFRGR